MRTTVRLDDALLEQAKREAAKRGETLTSLMEQGLRLVLLRTPASRSKQRINLPVSKNTGGVFPGVDISDSAGLLDIMEDYGPIVDDRQRKKAVGRR